MTDHFVAIITAVTALVAALTALGGVVLAIYKVHVNARQIEKQSQDMKKADVATDSRVDILLRSQLRRGEAEAITKNLVQPKKKEGVMLDLDYEITPQIRQAYGPITPSLRSLYANLGQKVPKERFAEVIEQHWGDWLQKHICLPLGVSDGACWQIALLLAQEPDPEHIMVA